MDVDGGFLSGSWIVVFSMEIGLDQGLVFDRIYASILRSISFSLDPDGLVFQIIRFTFLVRLLHILVHAGKDNVTGKRKFL